jgi:hypothetical protein
MGLFVLRDKVWARRNNTVRCRKHGKTKPGVGRAETAKAPIIETARGRVGGIREPRKQERVAAEGQVKWLARQKTVGLRSQEVRGTGEVGGWRRRAGLADENEATTV